MPRVVIKGQRNDLVWSQLLTEGMFVLTDADCLEVVAVEVIEGFDAHGDPCDHVACTLSSIDGSTFDRTYPLDHLVPTVPRTMQDSERVAA